MVDSHRKKGNKYILPRALYNQTIWLIRGYFILLEQVDAIIDDSPPPSDGQPRGTDIADQVAIKAIRRESKMAVIKVIENAINSIPKEYRDGVWKSVQFRTPYPTDADRTTYARRKSKFVYDVAKNLHWL